MSDNHEVNLMPCRVIICIGVNELWEKNTEKKSANTNIKGNGVISPSCGLIWILPLKMLRGCIFTTVGISKNKI